MSAVMTKPIRLELPFTREMPRKLLIEWDSREGLGVHIHAHAFIRASHNLLSVAFGAAHEVKDAHLSYRSPVPVLWLRSTQFDLTPAEAAEVERLFEPVGLRIDRLEPRA